MSSISRELLIINKRGLHVRGLGKIRYQMVEGFQAEVQVSKDGMTVGEHRSWD